MDLLEQLTAALGDRYRVERELGHGGMAIVFLAEDLKHRRRVAIKLLKPDLSAVLGSERFLREIEIAATLQHPHILPLYDSGQAGGLLYYVMPFAEGESLRQRLAREQQLPLDAALRITREVGSALQYAHERGVIHRDIKPENIMLSEGHAVVADFGIARALHAASQEQLTLTGMVVGTPQYMSPEQAAGAAVDGRSDQYSLACTLYEMLSGQPPFTGPSSQAVIARHSLDPVPGLRVVRQTVPQALEAAVIKAMAKLPVDRFASMQRFLEALEAPDGVTVPTAVPARSRGPSGARVSRRVVAAALGAGALAAAAWWLVPGGRATRAHPGSRAVTAVAVLPFQNLASGPDSSYLGEGMTEGLIADLAQIGSLKVISRSSGAEAEGTARSLAELASKLGAEAVVKGSIRRVGDSVEVSVRFLQAPDSTLLFSGNYRGRLGELPDLQRKITLAITNSINAELKGAERSRLDARREVNQRAYEAYLRGRFHLEAGELEQARMQFERASQIAPDWAPPYVGLANYYTSLPFFTDVSPADVLPKARGALAQALELDETLAEAHAANAYIRAYYEWDWRAAEQEFRRALELRPSDADAYFSYSRFLASRRRLDEAIAQLGRAVELDPLSHSLQANRALLDYFAGRYDEAGSRLQQILKSDSTDALVKWGLALVAEQQGRPEEAIALLEPISGASLNRKASLGHAYAVAGKSRQARSILAALRTAAVHSYVPSYYFALVHDGLGERDQALRYLERAYQERSTVLAYLLIDPRLAPLRNDSRFVALARRLGGE
jgi:TolB-like protein/tRNA A-37 threonylcarbamoyl transferase component Bud32/thioredoxin-like negative regulator of GroEL